MARLPAREVVSATRYVTDLTLCLGEVVFDYLRDAGIQPRFLAAAFIRTLTDI